jgi:hypothetical protein
MGGLYDTVISNKEHLYSKILPRARKIYITTQSYQGLFTPLTKPTPTPMFPGGHPLVFRGVLRGVKKGGYPPPIHSYTIPLCPYASYYDLSGCLVVW